MHSINKLSQKEIYSILHYTGFIFILLSIILLSPIIIALIYNETNYILPFAYTSIISALIGILFYKVFENKVVISLKSAMLFSTGIWVSASAIGALPFYFSGELSYLNAYFEAISGFTTTGFTMFTNLDAVPYTLHFWRALTQWLGGVGIIVIALTILSSPSVNIMRMYVAEGRDERIRPSIRHTIKTIVYIYTSFTLIGFILFLIAGMPVFDSLFHTFTALSTGGFGMHGNSLAFYNSFWIELAAMIVMMIGATNFALHFTIIKGNWKEYFKDIETKIAYTLIAVSTIIISLILLNNQVYGGYILLSIRYSLFQVVSAVSTTGLQTADATDILIRWVGLGQFLIILIMIIGAGSFSTGGGIKWLRAGLLVKGIWWQVKSFLLPTKAIPAHKIHHITKINVKDDVLRLTGMFALSYIIIYILSVGIVMSYYSDIPQVLFEVASALSNVGLSEGLLTPDSPILVKLVFMIDFWIGRLEIWPVLLFLSIFVMNTVRR